MRILHFTENGFQSRGLAITLRLPLNPTEIPDYSENSKWKSFDENNITDNRGNETGIFGALSLQ